MTTLPNTGMTLPVRGAPGAGAWGDTLDANLAIIDAMDHSPGHGPLVPTSGLNINADLPFSALYAPTQLHRVQFSAIAGGSLTNPQNLSLFVSDGTGGLSANELYYRTSAGNHIKLTSGSTLNVAAFVGGIGGDYTSVSALLDYNDSNKEYRHRQGGGTAWARITGGGLRLIEFGTTETVYVEQLCPAGLASSYAVTWPLALPAATKALRVDASGVGTFAVPTYTIPQQVLGVGTGAITLGTTVPVGTTFSGAGNGHMTTLEGLTVGERIVAVRARVLDNVTGPTKLELRLYSSLNGAAPTLIATSAASSGGGTSQTISVTGLTTVIASTTLYFTTVTFNTGSANSVVQTLEVDCDATA